MLTIITPTGERPEAFSLCQKMLARQTYKGKVRWIVVDDGARQSRITLKRRNWSVEVIRPEPFWKAGDNTQGRNLSLALDLVGRDDLVVFWEDDDWYHRDWLKVVSKKSALAEVVGEANAVYYNVRLRKLAHIHNYEHASLRCSAIRGGAIDTMRDVLKVPYRYYDMKLWKRHPDKQVFEGDLTVGMKGLPGRAGIALGHQEIRGKADPKCEHLRGLIGSDAEWYFEFYEELQMTKTKYFVIRDFRLYGIDWKRGKEFVPKSRIDAELHLHAKKIERRTVVEKKAEPEPRKFKVKNQEQKLDAAVVEKDAGTVPPDQEENVTDGAFSDAEKPKRFSRRRKAESVAGKDE